MEPRFVLGVMGGRGREFNHSCTLCNLCGRILGTMSEPANPSSPDITDSSNQDPYSSSSFRRFSSADTILLTDPVSQSSFTDSSSHLSKFANPLDNISSTTNQVCLPVLVFLPLGSRRCL